AAVCERLAHRILTTEDHDVPRSAAERPSRSPRGRPSRRWSACLHQGRPRTVVKELAVVEGARLVATTPDEHGQAVPGRERTPPRGRCRPAAWLRPRIAG